MEKLISISVIVALLYLLFSVLKDGELKVSNIFGAGMLALGTYFIFAITLLIYIKKFGYILIAGM
jgi:hypothetical protein